MTETIKEIGEVLAQKTLKRMKKETILSKKTLKMISLSAKLFGVIVIWE